MKKILFVCLGNICRSPMAEFVMKRLVSEAGMAEEFEIASAATSTEELGNPVYPPARRKLAEHGIDCKGKTARQITKADYDYYDLIIGMDSSNLRNMHRFFGGDPEASSATPSLNSPSRMRTMRLALAAMPTSWVIMMMVRPSSFSSRNRLIT